MSIDIIIVLIPIRLIICGIFATEMHEIARLKNAKKNYWLWCFLLPLFGFMIVSSLPDRGDKYNQYNDLPHI